ncbi:MAG: hypothetical protein ACP59X_21055 [Solidesulfovibrio sp. DCME]|uniref:hypothetical protein n=1 Tax=Solidesulfovibrio sp. DCME TaxID=3447380 RepID=UPI003D10AD06
MTQDAEKYAFTDGITPLSATEFNTRFFDIVRRLDVLENVSTDWEAAIAEVRNYGLARINDAVRPLVEGLRADLEALIAQGQADLAGQSAAVAAKLAAVDAALAAVAATMTAIEARMAAVEAAQAQSVQDILKQARRLALIF